MMTAFGIWVWSIGGKVWLWWKKWWKWVLFPVGIAGFLLAGRRAATEWQSIVPPPPDDRTAAEIQEVLAERDRKLQELKQQHAAKLQQLSQAQSQELEELNAKPLEEVVQWFDKLSS